MKSNDVAQPSRKSDAADRSGAPLSADGVTSQRIVMVGTHPDTMGGISTVVRGYAAAGLFDRFPVTYVVTHRDGSALLKLKTALQAWLAVSRELLRGGAPLFHIHLSSRASFWRKLVVCAEARVARRPYILHVHGSEFMQFYRDECGPIARGLMRWAFAHAAAIIALSEEWRANLQEIGPSARIVVLPNAVALPDLRLRSAVLATKRRATNERVSEFNGHAYARFAPVDTTTIVFLGRLGERKGVFDLLRAFARASRRYPQARLVCAGDGEVDRAAELAEMLGIADRVSFPGWLSPERTHELLARAEIFVLPSRAEGLPMSLLEAMSWSVAPVVTAVGGIPHVIRDGLNGIFVTPGDVDQLASQLETLLDEPERRARLAAAARATIEQSFSIAGTVEQLTRIYRAHGVEPRASLRVSA